MIDGESIARLYEILKIKKNVKEVNGDDSLTEEAKKEKEAPRFKDDDSCEYCRRNVKPRTIYTLFLKATSL